MKAFITVLFIGVYFNACSQKLEGVYKLNLGSEKDTSLYLFYGKYYKHLYTINSWNGSDTHIRKIEEGSYKSDAEGLTLSDDDWSGDYTLSEITDSGILYIAVEDQKAFFKKTSISKSKFDSLFRTFSKSEKQNSPAVSPYPASLNPPRKLVLQNDVTKRTKTIRQRHYLQEIYRVYTDTIFRGIDTFMQTIEGHIDSIGDSLVYVKAHFLNTYNHYTLKGWYDFQSSKPEINIEWNISSDDTIICFPKSQLIGIKQHKPAATLGDGLIIASLTNAVASPIYSINYKTFVVNKPLLKTSLLTSAGILLTGIIIDIFASPNYYSFCKSCKKHWVLVRLKE